MFKRVIWLILFMVALSFGQGHIWTTTSPDSTYPTTNTVKQLITDSLDRFIDTTAVRQEISDSLSGYTSSGTTQQMIEDSLTMANLVSNSRKWNVAQFYSAPACTWDHGDSLHYIYLTDTTTLFTYIEAPEAMLNNSAVWFDSVEVYLHGDATVSIDEFAVGYSSWNGFYESDKVTTDKWCNGLDQCIKYNSGLTAPMPSAGPGLFKTVVNVPSGSDVKIYCFRMFYSVHP